ncbi:conserved hypothetical protein [Methanolacinia petrolearia DSM 11571]|uniref:Transglutaminase-like domain-containing protein n=1 Tax=Methanolacinia petrolearia (strain DSM 11571 / OCM 486 / SEBR 4847) TaxID=679926 RepID=E1RF75_METP4|nr:hypothetical protein [Methanolacinia petrolearia]ADN35023.1 conserved hypothetical protein [Methanolacinia petrolearia DSM 11571]
MLETDFFDKLLDDWADGLLYPESQIAVFNRIRDLPYAIMPDQTDPLRGPLNLLKEGRGDCTSKHFLLGILFERLGISVKYMSVPFLWDQQEFRYPDNLRELAESLPVSYHLACRALIGERWVLVDATWDIPLAAAGFPVNKEWDGLSDTLLGVVPTLVIPPEEEESVSEIVHESADERPELHRKVRRQYTPEDFARRKEFDEEFGLWLDEIRRGNRREE